MLEQKPFLEPSLTINDLADKTQIMPRYLSQIINECLNQNFYDFVNSYRINEAKKYLLQCSSRKTILEILYEVGFNSKTAFNVAFKNMTGMSPTQYRKQHLN
jgi:YesN/AraC family two-component response regulator